MKNPDVVVAGSGAGGAAVAGRLAAGGARVLLLEKGRRAKAPADAMDAVARYYAEAGCTAALGSALLPIPTGITVGGTTTINSGTCLKTPPELLRRWQRKSAGRFAAADFSQRLDEAWSALKVRRAPESTLSRSSRLVLEGLARLGIAGGPLDRCEDACTGLGRCCFVCPSGGKMTSDRAFLQDDGPELRTGCELVSIRPPRAAGEPVRLTVRGGGTIECGTLVLATGALATPYYLRACGVKAGDGLSLHPAAKLFARFAAPVRGWEGVPQGVGFLDPEDDAVRCEGVYTPPEMAALTMPLEGRALRRWMESYERVATFGYMIRDDSRGSVRYPLGPARPLIRYEMSGADLARMGRGMRRVAQVFFAAGAERVVLPVNRPDCELGSERELAEFDFASLRPGQLQMMAFHPLGTCAMGEVVDEDLRAAPGVYVCDGSVVPESLGVNPQITIYSFALRLAAHLLGRRAAA
ncbi:MAG: GMC family oxidoreductase [Elusimicrobiota bacterium]